MGSASFIRSCECARAPHPHPHPGPRAAHAHATKPGLQGAQLLAAGATGASTACPGRTATPLVGPGPAGPGGHLVLRGHPPRVLAPAGLR